MGERTKFLLKNLARGLFWLAVIIFLFLFIKKNVDVETYERYSHILDDTLLVYIIYTLSEILFGIIPPEIFMIWGLDQGETHSYIAIISSLAVLSYIAGVIGYFFGRFLHTTLLYRFLRRKFLRKYERLLNTYGLYLIVVASLTPLPFSAICMLVGSVKYPCRKFFFYTLFRFVRFIAYSIIIWETVSL